MRVSSIPGVTMPTGPLAPVLRLGGLGGALHLSTIALVWMIFRYSRALMATRPIFRPTPGVFPYVEAVETGFEWYPGFSKAQAQRSIASLHAAAERIGIKPLLEISSKAPTLLGVRLSAFNLEFRYAGHLMTVECAFQGSKVFAEGGPYQDIYIVTSRDAKRDSRLTSSGEMIGFRLFDREMPTIPVTAFYDWLYLMALIQNQELAAEIMQYQGFSDIAFNPERSWNCQARSAALFVALAQTTDVHQFVDMDVFVAAISYNQPPDSDAKSDRNGQLRLL